MCANDHENPQQNKTQSDVFSDQTKVQKYESIFKKYSPKYSRIWKKNGDFFEV